jgi:hypothetical protein
MISITVQIRTGSIKSMRYGRTNFRKGPCFHNTVPTEFLGLTVDEHTRLAHWSSVALASLRTDYHFWRAQQMAAGRLGLPAVGGFGRSGHVRLAPKLQNDTNATMTLLVCGGDSTVTWRLTVPPATSSCTDQSLANNNNTAFAAMHTMCVLQ